MKKLSFLLAVIMVVMCIPFAAMTTISAADSTAPDGYTLTDADKAAFDEGKPFKVGTTYYQYLDDAFNVAKTAGGENTIHFVGDVTIDAGNDTQRGYDGNPSEDIYIEGHGFTVNDNYGAGSYGWRVENGQRYTIYINDLTIKTIGFWQLKGNVTCTNVKVYSKNSNGQTTGAVLLQKNTYVVFDGDSYLESNPNAGINTAEDGTKSRPNSTNPVIALNERTNIVVDIKGNTVIRAANSVMMYRHGKGETLDNVVFNIYDNADIRTVSTDYTGNLLFTCEWRNMGINVYGGYLTTVDGSKVVNIGSGVNCTGSYLNVYGGFIDGEIWFNDDICDLGIYGGKFTAVGGNTYDTRGITQKEGASIRYTTGSSGIRFESNIPYSVYQSIEAGAVKDSIKIGTIIVPYDYLAFTYKGQITKDCFDGISYLDIPAVNALEAMKNYDYEKEGIVVRGAMIGIQEKNLDRDFVATGYISWVDSVTGEELIVYSNPLPTEADARNVSDIAFAALSDVKDNETTGYAYSTTTYVYGGQLVNNGVKKYSKYDQTAMDTIAALLKTK